MAFIFAEMLRTKAIQERAEIRQADPLKSEIPGTWRLVVVFDAVSVGAVVWFLQRPWR